MSSVVPVLYLGPTQALTVEFEYKYDSSIKTARVLVLLLVLLLLLIFAACTDYRLTVVLLVFNKELTENT